MMATLDKDMQISDCPVCHERYSDPKILPCAHLLCRDCLLRWMKTNTDALCPLCRSNIVDPKHSKLNSVDAFVDSLPTDHAMSAMVESLNILSEKHVCHVHDNADAISLCLHCNIKLCQGCNDVHGSIPSTSFHKVEDLTTLTPEILAAIHQPQCCIHLDKTAELVCKDHNILICELCAITKHRACSEVTYVSEMSEKYKQSLLEMESKLRVTESSLNQAITELEERLLTAEKSTNAALGDIDATCDSILKSVETCRKRLKKLITEKNDKLKAAVHEQKYIISHKRLRVISHQGLVKRVLQMANNNSLVAMARNLESRVNDLDVSLPHDTYSDLKVTLKIDRSLISRVQEELHDILVPIFHRTCRTKESPWMYHESCGSNIQLTSNRQTAKVKDSTIGEHRLVISREPMSANNLYQVLVEETDTRYSGAYSAIGVCEENVLYSTLPSNYFQMKTFVGVDSYGDISYCQRTKGYSFHALKSIKVGSRLGVMVDTSHSLHVYVDGTDQGVVAKIVAQPCYAVFDLRYFLKKVCVSTLPLSTIE